ncbi:MAG: CCA tRNA nucleotidyltransferase [Sphingobium sp.]
MASLPDTLWNERPGFQDLCALLGAQDGHVRIVGGAVRDWLLGIDVNDIDLATPLLPDEVMQRLSAKGIKVVPTGIAHGTVTAVIHHHPVEITTLRRDVSTDGRRAIISYTDDWREDAARRDFTMNALYADPISGEIHDYFGGMDDLKGGNVRFIGSAAQRIAEDHLRILRYFRFLARFGALPPDEEAYRACTDNANSLMALSRERIADELLKLLALADPLAVLRLMIKGGIFVPIVPEIGGVGLDRVSVLIERERAADLSSWSPLLRLAALLPQEPITVEKVAARLKLSNKARQRMADAVSPPPAHRNAFELAYRIGNEAAIDQILLNPGMDLAGIAAIQDWQKPRFPLSGRDILSHGVKAGPEVARILAKITDMWIERDFPSREETLKIADQLIPRLLDSSQ